MTEPVAPHLIVENLTVSHRGVPLLRDAGLIIPRRQITCIIGPSGCGKSTLLKSFNRLHDLEPGMTMTGRILHDGADLLAPGVDPDALRRCMGLLLQRPVVLPLSIYDNVAFAPRVHDASAPALRAQLAAAQQHFAPAGFAARIAAAARTHDLLDLLVEYYLTLAGLWDEVRDRLRAPATQLSIGQQQRLCLARGLAAEPAVILADEPTSALDPPSAQRIEDRLLALREHYTIVVVTHTRAQAKRLADYVVFLYLGEVIEHGLAAQVLNQPQDPRTATYLAGKFITAGPHHQ